MRLNEGGAPYQCDAEGQVYRLTVIATQPDGTVTRLARDGSTMVFRASEAEGFPLAYAPANPGLVLLWSAAHDPDPISHDPISHQPIYHYPIYHFDGHGNTLTQHAVSLDFRPNTMAVTSSGKTVVVGYLVRPPIKRETLQWVAAILDGDDKVVQRFDLPSIPGVDHLEPGLMVGGDGTVNLLLKVMNKPFYAVATITEPGQVEIKMLSVPADGNDPWHGPLLFGPGVVVDGYLRVGMRPLVYEFDEYDLSSGKKLRTRTVQSSTIFAIPCYLGDEIVALASHEDGGGLQSVHRLTVRLK